MTQPQKSAGAQVVLITGAGRGIGRAVALAFARHAAQLVLISRTQRELDGTAAEAQREGARADVVRGDISKRADAARIFETVRKLHSRLDVLVNAAGVYGPIGPLAGADMTRWAEAIEINLLGTAYCMHAALPLLTARGGSIINFSGGGAVSPLPRFSAYSASKAAVVRLTETIAEEVCGAGVRVNAIAPGAVNTRLLGQVLEAGETAGKEFYAKAVAQKVSGGTPPERAAELAVFLASPAAAGITGRVISAVWDDWRALAGRGASLAGSSLYTLRRIDGRNFAEVRAAL